MASSRQHPALESHGDGHRTAGKIGRDCRRKRCRMDSWSDNVNMGLMVVMTLFQTAYLSFNAMSCSNVVSPFSPSAMAVTNDP